MRRRMSRSAASVLVREPACLDAPMAAPARGRARARIHERCNRASMATCYGPNALVATRPASAVPSAASDSPPQWSTSTSWRDFAVPPCCFTRLSSGPPQAGQLLGDIETEPRLDQTDPSALNMPQAVRLGAIVHAPRRCWQLLNNE